METLYQRLLEICRDQGVDAPRPKDISAICGISSGRPKQIKDAGGAGRLGEKSLRRLVALGYSPDWVQDGKKPKRLLPSSSTQTELIAAKSPGQNQESAMLLNFPKTIDANDSYTIPEYRAGGSMGHGLLLPDQPGVIQNWSVSREWLNKNARNITGAANLCIVTGFGPSMQPMFNPGDPLLVDTGITRVIAEGVYFFRIGEEGFIKLLQRVPTASGLKYVAKSKNPDYDNFEITPDMDFEVLGKVVRVWCGTDF